MPVNVQERKPLSPKDLLVGILAELSLEGVDSLTTSDAALHGSFAKALERFRSAGGELAHAADLYFEDEVTGKFDELEQALMSAQGNGYVRYPNPTYRRFQLTITPKAATTILARRPEYRQVFEDATEILRDEMSKLA